MRARRTSLAAAVAVFALVGAACSDDSSTSAETTAATTATTAAATATTAEEGANGLEGGPYDIVGTALSRSDLFSQLAGYVVKAKLVETLKSAGPFTVFAPTDEAFAKIPLDTLHSVTDDDALLTTVLTYHVVPGKLKLADLKAGKLKTVAGPELTITKIGDATYVNGNKIALGDIEATNGEIHVLADVLVPPVGDIIAVATALKGFGTLADLVTKAGLIETLKGPGPFTVFAPVDGAFAGLPAGTLAAVGADKALLTKVLTYHVVPGALNTDQLQPGKLKTVAGLDLIVERDGDVVYINSIPIAVANVQATNGVIHALGGVLLPAG